MGSLPFLLIAAGVMMVVWARWLPRKMARVRDGAVAAGRGREFDERWPAPAATAAIRFNLICGPLVIVLGVLMLALGD